MRRNIKLDEGYIIAEYILGKTIAVIAKELDVSPQTISRRLIKNNVLRRIGQFQKGHKMHAGVEKGWIKKGSKGSKSLAWRGGIRYSHGYKAIYKPHHPNNSRDYVLEHRLVMEKHLGRYLKPEEVVHHKNEDKLDNRIENLQLFKSNSEHIEMHVNNRKRNSKGHYLPLDK